MTVFRIEVDPEDKCLIAFKEWMCRHFKVKTVDDLQMSDNEYCDYMDTFFAGYRAKEQEILDRLASRI